MSSLATATRQASSSLPYLSHSRVSRYLHCPEQYRLYYVENLRPRVPSVNLVFGQVLHEALATLFQGADPIKHFQDVWSAARQIELRYSSRDSWERLNTVGQGLIDKFVEEELPKVNSVQFTEERFEFRISSLDVPFVGVIDLVADLEGKRTVIDFKSSSTHYQAHEVALSDQLTAYQLAEPGVESLALCILVKTKDPKIQWFKSSRDPEQLKEYLAKLDYVAHEMAAGRFYKRPGKWCGWCDFLPVCLGDHAKAARTLTQTS